MRIVVFIALSLIAAPAGAEEAPFLFDVLLTPDWLNQFSRNFDGVAGPMKPLAIEGKAYELYFVCKPQDCAAKKFEVMFEAASKRAYGALGGISDPPFFYGQPTPAMQEALAKGLKD